MYLRVLLFFANYCFSLAMDPDIIDMLTPDPQFHEACGYQRCITPEKADMYIHVVPYSHNEMGYTATFYGHYTGKDNYVEPSTINVKRILDYTISELWMHEHRRFTYSDMAYFFHWWSNRDETVRRMVYQMIRQGRLNFVGGGWSMSDEATTSYHAIIDHFTYTLRKINATFLDCARPLVAWQADVYGHSREFASLMAQMGFDGLFVNPISFDDELPRMRRKAMEFVWRGSDDLGPESDIYTHKLFDGYWPPPGFCFSTICKDPLLITSSDTMSNVVERIDEFVRMSQERQAPWYTTKHIMVMMGMREGYHDASVWFKNVEKLIGGTNSRYLDVNAFFSTPACYLRSVYDASPQLQTKQDDFLPYAHDKNSYAVGMYTSRPSIKYLAREGHRYLQIAKQLQVMARLGNNDRIFEEYNWINGAFQDHNIISGEMRHYVAKYYVARMHKATLTVLDNIMEKGINKLRNNTHNMQTLIMCKFNVSRCHCTTGRHFYIVIYNPLAWPVTMPIRLPMFQHEQIVFDHKGKRVKAGLMELPQPVQNIPERQSKADFELVFIAEDIPPMGIRSYYLQRHQTGWERPKRSSNIHKTKGEHFIKKHSIFSDQGPTDQIDDLPDYEYFEDFSTTEHEKVDKTEINNLTTTTYKNNNDTVTTTEFVSTTTEYNESEVTEEASIDVTTDKNNSTSIETTEKITTTTTTTENNVDSETFTTTTTENGVDSETITTITTVNGVDPETITTTTTGNEVNFEEISIENAVTTEKTVATEKEVLIEEAKTTEKAVSLEQVVTRESLRRIDADAAPETTVTEPSQPSTKTTTEDIKPSTKTTLESIPTTKATGFLSDRGPPDYKVRKFDDEDDDDVFDYWSGYPSFIMNEHSYIRNRFTRVNLDAKKKVINISLANGIKINLNIQIYYYVSDDPVRMNRDQRPPGAYLFRTMDSKAEILDSYEANVYKNQVVQELHMKFSSWASASLRLYSHSPVLEVDWLVGPIPITDGLGKEILIKYSTNLVNKGVFYTDSNGRQTIKRIRNMRPTFDPVNKDPIAGNFYPVTSKIYIEDLTKNIRFAVLNDRAQGGSSLRDGEINMLLHRRILTEDSIQEAALNESDYNLGTVIRGQHYIYISKADHKPYRVFEKKLAKEIELKPQIMVSPAWGFGIRGKPIWMSQRNEYSGLKNKLPLGVHLLTLEQWNDDGLLIRFENYLEKADAVKSGIKKVYLKDLFSFIKILDIKEMMLAAHMSIKDFVPLSWSKDKFLKNFNDAYGSGKFEFDETERSKVLEEVDVNGPITLKPQQIRTFVVKYRYI